MVVWVADNTGFNPENVESRGQAPITTNQGGTKLTVESGGEIEIQSGATLDVQSGATTDFSGGVDLNAGSLILDANGNTSITADTDDPIDIEVSGADDFVITANLFESQTGSVIDMNGTKLGLDADADTSITSDTDDQIDIEIGGTDIFQLLGNVATNVSADILDITASVGIQNGSDAAIGLDLNLTGDNHTSTGNTIVGIDLDLTTPDADSTETALAINDTDWDIGIESVTNLENIGIPSVASAAVTYTSSGAIFTITDGEVWFVTSVIIEVTTNFDCTGDDCTVDVGDGTDVDGFLNLADADLQAAATDYTGSPAGWQGVDGATPAGVFIIGGPHVYAPSGADETIDIAVAGNTPAAGVANIYIFYTRTQ